MISRALGIVACCLTLMLGFTGCSSDGTTGLDVSETRISPDVFSVDEHPGVMLLGREDSTYKFSYAGSQPDIAAGDIIVGSEAGGYLRRVSSVSVHPGTLEIKTTWASLTDAVISGSADTSFQLDLDLLSLEAAEFNAWRASDSAGMPAFAAPGVTITNRGLDLSGVTLFSGNTGDGELSVVILDGSIEFSPQVTTGFELRNRQVDEFHMNLLGDLAVTLDVDFEASMAMEVSHETLLASTSMTTRQMIGNVPVVQVVTVNIFGGFELRTLDYLLWRTGVEADADMEMGAEYRNSKWQQTWNSDSDFYNEPFEWTANSEIETRVYIKPRVEVAFYDMAGQSIECEPYVRGEGGVFPVASRGWSLHAGINGRLDFNLGILGGNVPGFSVPISDRETPLNSGTLTDWELVYSEDFSSDPGWTTNDDTLYYWDSSDEVYHAEIWTADEDVPSDPETYSVIELPYESESWLRLEFDALMAHSDWASGLNFGLYDADLCFHGNSNTINIEFTNPDDGRGFALFAHNCSYSNRPNIAAAFVGFNLDEWYHVEILYEYGDVRSWVKNSSGVTVASLCVRDFGSFCPGSSLYLGISRKCVRYYPKKAVAEIDNVKLYKRSRDGE